MALARQDTTDGVTTAVPVRVLFFARAREIMGANECSLRLTTEDGAPEWRGRPGDLMGLLEEAYRDLGEIRGAYTLAVNQEYIARDEPLVLRQGDEIALITPISGG